MKDSMLTHTHEDDGVIVRWFQCHSLARSGGAGRHHCRAFVDNDKAIFGDVYARSTQIVGCMIMEIGSVDYW